VSPSLEDKSNYNRKESLCQALFNFFLIF